ncbi:malate dehydrogenase [Synechocystis sp. PCC 7338]|uniref:malate dehydrogenase n=1 Tax=Synechocystis sp. PCC 7338 TaxID=2732530 RepID=UPI001BAF2426|nr:malate dehydrogenase [Synechocystis sp. PCC 7338]QUS59694.1 malate dehydrogenase [Synechocystis sp. PCC 7338]
MNSLEYSPIACQSLQVTVVGAGNVGRTLAQRLVQQNVANVVLLDIVPGLPQGIALDLMSAQSVEEYDSKIVGTNDYEATAGSDVVVITAGLPRKPGMSRDDLLGKNANIVAQAARETLRYSPNAILIVVTNPLDVMTYLAWKVTGLPSQRVIGMAGVLDSARLKAFIAMKLGACPSDINTLVLGGHGDLMLPLPRYCTVSGVPITELIPPQTIAELVERTRNGGAEIAALLQTGTAYYAPASSAGVMVESILRNQSRILPAATYLDGMYGLKDIFLGVPCRLGCRGVEDILEVQLTPEEKDALHLSAEAVRRNIDVALAMVSDD